VSFVHHIELQNFLNAPRTMEGLEELTNALSNGVIPDPLRPPLPQDWGFATPTQNCNRYYVRDG